MLTSSSMVFHRSTCQNNSISNSKKKGDEKAGDGGERRSRKKLDAIRQLAGTFFSAPSHVWVRANASHFFCLFSSSSLFSFFLKILSLHIIPKNYISLPPSLSIHHQTLSLSALELLFFFFLGKSLYLSEDLQQKNQRDAFKPCVSLNPEVSLSPSAFFFDVDSFAFRPFDDKNITLLRSFALSCRSCRSL